MKLVSVLFLMLGLAVSANAQGPKSRNTTAPTYTNTAPAAMSYGSAYTNEIIVGLQTQGGFASYKACKDCPTGSILTLTGSYLRYWQNNMQYGVTASFINTSKEFSKNDKSATRIEAIGVGVYNLQSDLANSIFAKAGVGLYSALKDDGSDYENKIGLFIGAGKRFAWLKNVSFSPEVRLVKRGDIDFAIEADILAFSIMW